MKRILLFLLSATLIISFSFTGLEAKPGKGKADKKIVKAEKMKKAKKEKKEKGSKREKEVKKDKKEKKEKKGKNKEKAKKKFGKHSDKVLKKLIKEENKHLRRMAKIDKLEEIAKKKKDTKLLEKVQMIREKEIKRHEKAMKRLKADTGEEKNG